jgi:hypothetical protein
MGGQISRLERPVTKEKFREALRQAENQLCMDAKKIDLNPGQTPRHVP